MLCFLVMSSGGRRSLKDLRREEVFDLVFDALGGALMEVAADAGVLLKEFPLPGAEFFRNVDVDAHHLVTTVRAPESRHPFALEMEGLARGCTRRDFELCRSVQRGHLDLAPEDRSGERQGHLAEYRGALTLEDRMFLYEDNHIEVAGRPAKGSEVTFVRELQTRADVNAGRDLDGEFSLDPDLARTIAGMAGVGDDPPRPLAFAAGFRHGEEALLEADLTTPPALRAGDGRFACLSSRAAADFTALPAGNRDRLLNAGGCRLKTDCKVIAEVCSLRGAVPAASGEAPEEVIEDVLEDVTEGGAAAEAET